MKVYVVFDGRCGTHDDRAAAEEYIMAVMADWHDPMPSRFAVIEGEELEIEIGGALPPYPVRLRSRLRSPDPSRSSPPA